MTETLHKLYRVRTCSQQPCRFLSRSCRVSTPQPQPLAEHYHCSQDWEANASVNCIILKGVGEKAFCAGGDVKGVVQQILRGEQDEPIRHAKHRFCGAPET